MITYRYSRLPLDNGYNIFLHGVSMRERARNRHTVVITDLVISYYHPLIFHTALYHQ